MKAMTPESKLAEARRMIQHIINTANESIETFSEEAKRDFCNFFKWYAEAMYQAQMKHTYFTEMQKATERDDYSALVKSIKVRIQDIENFLINSSVFGTCAKEIACLEYRLSLEGHRELLYKLKNILWELED